MCKKYFILILLMTSVVQFAFAEVFSLSEINSKIENAINRIRMEISFFEKVCPDEKVNIKKLSKDLRTVRILNNASKLVAENKTIPELTYTLFNDIHKTGERRQYEDPYFLKRRILGNAAMLVYFGGRKDLVDLVNDYIWSICEETTWVIPAHHPGNEIDLFAAQTGFLLAETICLLDEYLPGEVKNRVRQEIDKRIFTPYIENHKKYAWYKVAHNWNGVCNGQIGSTFIYLENDNKRLIKALKIAVEGIQAYILNAFEQDGGTTEGIGYWNYGLRNVLVFSELLRARTGNSVDLLAVEKMKKIASYPLAVMLSPKHFVSFADAREEYSLSPYFIQTLSKRTGNSELRYLFKPDDSVDLRNIICVKESKNKPEYKPTDICLKNTGICKMVGVMNTGEQIAIAAQANNNGVNHNHNDVGSFVLYIDNEIFLCDPGSGRYTTDYFTDKRYNNIFANSFGHSVPVIGNQLQKAGSEFKGTITEFEPLKKKVVIELAEAYGLDNLKQLQRTFILQSEKGKVKEVMFKDSFRFSDNSVEIEEAFVTWLPVTCSQSKAFIKGKKHTVIMSIEEPKNVEFTVAEFVKESKENDKKGILKRISYKIPANTGNVIDTKLSIKLNN